MADNMKIWDAVEKTDPKHTKPVNQRGGFTAIAAHSQIMAATKQFGPIGVGWGYTVERTERMDQFFLAHVSIWHGDRETVFGPIVGCAEMFGNRPDSDAPKKATTDAITKGLSQIGFNADVFLGRFDDNKYIEERKRDVAQEERDNAPEPTPAESRDALKKWINGPKTTPDQVKDAWLNNDGFKSKLAALPEPMRLEIKAAVVDVCPELGAE